jgi:CHAT domain-containing protein/tetratricopeptide (TPR) repeat protein
VNAWGSSLFVYSVMVDFSVISPRPRLLSSSVVAMDEDQTNVEQNLMEVADQLLHEAREETALTATILATPELIQKLKKIVDRSLRTNPQEALRLAQQTHLLAQQLDDPLMQALGMRALALALHVSGRHAEAVKYYEQARTLYLKNDQRVEAARLARAMVDALMLQGQYERALQLADEARLIFIAYGERVQAAQLEVNVGNIYHRQDQYHEALRCFDRASQVLEETEDRTAQAMIAYNRANIYSNLDDFRRAQQLYEQAYDILHAQGQTALAAEAKYSLGYLHFLKGAYHHATRVLHEVQEELLRLGSHRLAALCDLDLAEIYLQMHVLDEAKTKAIQARTAFLALDMRYEAAKALTWEGLACLHLQQTTVAAALLEQACAEFAAEGNDVWRGLLKIYLAELYLKENQPAQALPLTLRAQKIFAEQRLTSKLCYAQLLQARGLRQMGQLQAAYLRANDVRQQMQALQAPWLQYQVHELIGDLLLTADDPDKGYAHYVHAISYIEQMRGQIRVEEFRTAFFGDKLRIYEKLIALCLQDGSPERAAEAFYYLESHKARTLVDLMVNDLEVMPSGVTPETQAIYERWQQLREELHWFYSRASQSEGTPNNRLLIKDEKLRTEILTRERMLLQLTRQAQIQDAKFGWLENIGGLKIEELRALLAADETVIEYYFDDEALQVFVIDPQQMHVISSPVGRNEIRQMVVALKFQLEKFQYGKPYVTAHERRLLQGTNNCLQKLWQALFAPVAALVAERKLIIVPFDLLHNVPFQALYDGQHYLLDTHELAVMPSARLLALCSRQPARPLEKALVFGVPDELSPQIGTEVEAIRSLFPTAQCFLGEAADRQALAAHIADSDVVHIASHAVFRQDNPMFSAFQMAGTWLNFFDICALQTNAMLVTLSGCSTGANHIYAGDELLGLVRGFLSAGAASLVVSLWTVNDPATATLMKAFYERLQQGESPRSALRQAALHTRQEYPHPYFWAPFVLIGRTPAQSYPPEHHQATALPQAEA